MKNLITIALLVFLTLTTSSCALFSEAQAKAGWENIIADFNAQYEELRDTDPPNDDTDSAKNSANKADVTKSYSDSSNKSDIYVGVAFPVSITEKFGVQPEIKYIVPARKLHNFQVFDKKASKTRLAKF